MTPHLTFTLEGTRYALPTTAIAAVLPAMPWAGGPLAAPTTLRPVDVRPALAGVATQAGAACPLVTIRNALPVVFPVDSLDQVTDLGDPSVTSVHGADLVSGMHGGADQVLILNPVAIVRLADNTVTPSPEA
ncbi:chemotaxis protein CheW [Actinotalea sp. M2MS4P-6]|uniref:chemotaxis protein CheW n=1 Tax=Actinotalea sp. M2MS4P-6 TaxID=2983762 RepID=UPI0021E4ED51|nr:chemotaxis protein CheW [Actinotalea sp. M2MS4P-6]MCV2393307.1 chemotaxis protein CheW [Actinotalea sp. M2MS4P-6]